ncbi:hypothetical protein FJT64_014175 [Amphibalanus amphitrite]|uniref:C-type lectin domain-containing protein n=1 Tax=Amphibalanus amphitrite TaxID=1232801 RepID=A0A6A4V2V1_AMPAM|nr:hypothetical protein FJT64_014175 [Amphibalanus amphitrite]KAF0287429.1 hypothetical protein FJT64_014175 [Amphibalanus amphitrite]
MDELQRTEDVRNTDCRRHHRQDLSWRQCLDDVGSSVAPMQRNTWAVDGRCYHLITQPDKRLHAEKSCQRLGTGGTLYEPAAGLDLALDMLNVEGVFRLQTRSKTHVWVQGMEEQNSEAPGGHLSAILGGAVGGVIVLALTALGVIRGRNGRRQRRRHKQFVPPVDDSSEFLGLNPNPIYGGSQHEDEHLYSEVSNPDAIYEECSYTAPVKQPSPEPPPPPPLPASRPSVGSLTDAAYAPSTDDLDYEVFPMETAPAPTGGVLTTGRSTTAAGTSAPPAREDPDYEPFPVDPQMPSGESSSATGLSISDPPRSLPAVPEVSRPPTLEYAVPLVGGKQPDGRQLNHSFNTLPIGVAPVADEAEYAQPYRASRADTARRSIPDVALNAMGMSRTESD